MSDALKESLKELGRLALFGLVGVAVAYFSDLPATPTTVAVLSVLRWLDKYLHEKAKASLKSSDESSVGEKAPLIGRKGLFGLKGLSGF